MEAVRDKWTDERLDDLNKRADDGFEKVDKRFEKVEERFDRLEGRMDRKFDRIDARLDGMTRAMLVGALTLSGVMLSGFIAIFTLIATRL
jgi:chromosome segregation ATPase